MQVYKGSDTKFTISDLEPGAEYSCRVCPIRIASSGELLGAYSPICNFSTLSPDPPSGGHRNSTSSNSVTNSPQRHRRNQRYFLSWLTSSLNTNGLGTSSGGDHSRPMSDKQRALIILIGFTIFAILSAVLVEKFINWRQSV